MNGTMIFHYISKEEEEEEERQPRTCQIQRLRGPIEIDSPASLRGLGLKSAVDEQWAPLEPKDLSIGPQILKRVRTVAVCSSPNALADAKM